MTRHMILHLSDVYESAEVYADRLTCHSQYKQNWQTMLCHNYIANVIPSLKNQYKLFKLIGENPNLKEKRRKEPISCFNLLRRSQLSFSCCCNVNVYSDFWPRSAPFSGSLLTTQTGLRGTFKSHSYSELDCSKHIVKRFVRIRDGCYGLKCLFHVMVKISNKLTPSFWLQITQIAWTRLKTM